MGGVFSKEKQVSYINEVEKFFLPMTKETSYNFPEKISAYFNIKHVLKSQIRLISLSI